MSAAAWLAVLDATWAAPERARLGDWTLRRGHGGGSRVSAISPNGDPGLPLAEAVERASAICLGWGQRPLFQIGPDDGAVDAFLDAAGWAAYDHSIIYTAATALTAARPKGMMVIRVRGPLAALDELWAEGGVGAARRAVMAATPAPKEIIMLRLDDRPAAAVFVACAGEAAMLHALHVAPDFRRRGLGRAAVVAAAERAQEMGATTLALAVTAANAPARALYERMGFEIACAYHYRRAPEPSCAGC